MRTIINVQLNRGRTGLRVASAVLALAIAGGVGNAWAAEAVVPEALRAKTLAERKDGLEYKLTLGATGSANSASNVVGANEGTTVQIGVVLQGDAKLTAGGHSWETEGRVQHAQTRTPKLDAFVKSADVLELQSTWMYGMGTAGIFGPFGRVKLATQLLASYDVRPADISVTRTAVDGTAQTDTVTAQGRTSTTAAFEPLVLTETVGAFANPVDSKLLKLKAKAGAGAQQIIASDWTTSRASSASRSSSIGGRSSTVCC